ncbi:serine/threonine-protein kinase [Promicromonospora iranensis]|uniref:serine/threonine-protein kinase n=1 Tax=Promicromonospora iranensis TaxID=1105144 RepID=UPI0023A9D1D3|nr:serine/threonine-protein kinase [Promicromonospora iranensis]
MIVPGSGAAPQIHPLEASDPQELGGYQLLGRIGAGGMGVVYLAETRTGRKLALKAILKEFVQDPEFRTRFRREAAAAMKVRGRYLATLIDADPDGAQPWLAVEYVEGPALTAVVQSRGPLPEPDVRRVLAGVAEALRAVHQVGIVHRDLKPSNILIGQDGPFVIDFGIAQASDSTSLTRTGLKVGTPSFMAPEQIRGSVATPAADIWALGAVALYAATGQRAFGEGDTTVVYYRVVHEEPDLSACPAWLLPLVRACLDKDPEARPDLQEVLDFLNEVPAGLRTATTRITPGPAAGALDDDQTALRDDDATVLKVERAASPAEPEAEPAAEPAKRRSALSRPITWIVAAASVLVIGAVITAVTLGMPSGSPDAGADTSASPSGEPSAEPSAAAIDECLVGEWRLDSMTTQMRINALDETVEATGFDGRVTEFLADGTQLVHYDDAQPARAETSIGELTETWTGTARYIVSTEEEGTLTTSGSDFRDVQVTIALAGESAERQPNAPTQQLTYTCDETTYTEQGDGFEASYTKVS